MGLAMEVINAFVTNPGAAITACAAAPGDSLSIKNFDPPNNAWLGAWWPATPTAGINRIRSPRLHDNVQGIRVRTPAITAPIDVFSEYDRQKLYAQDTLILEQSGGGAETEAQAILVMYEDLPGSAPRLSTLEAILPRIVNVVNVEVACTASAGVGAYSASVALNATTDLLIANTDYALLGYECDNLALTVGMRGPDTGNLRIGGPATNVRSETRDWFVRLGKRLNVPTIPIINSANKAATLCDLFPITALNAVNVNWVMAQLTP